MTDIVTLKSNARVNYSLYNQIFDCIEDNEYQNIDFLQPLVAEISWAKHIAIMNKCKDAQEHRFYIADWSIYIYYYCKTAQGL